MLKKKVLTTCVGTGFILLSHSTMALEINYEHKYEDISKEHTDELEISHDFASGLGIGTKFKFKPREQENGDAGRFFGHREITEKEFKINYTADITKNFSIEPGFTFALKPGEEKYKPSLKFKYRPFHSTKLSLRYRKEISDRDEKATKRMDRVDAEISQSIGDFKLSYTFTGYHANEDLYNNKRTDFEHKVELGYHLTKHLTPFIGVKNVSVSKKTSQRQSEFITGISYEF